MSTSSNRNIPSEKRRPSENAVESLERVKREELDPVGLISPQPNASPTEPTFGAKMMARSDGKKAHRDNHENGAKPHKPDKKLRFYTAAEIAKMTPAQPDWVAKPWAAIGTITEVDGKPKVAGKTTWLLWLIRAVLRGENFLGEPTTKGPVVYLTEQSLASFAVALKKVGLLRHRDLIVLSWPHTIGKSWRKIIQAAYHRCKKVGAKLLIIDTLPQFAGIAGDAENNAGDALAAMYPLQIVAARGGLAVVVARHERKAGGEVGDAARGSSAFAGAVDTILSIRRPRGKQRPTLREVHSFSRDSGESDLVIELTPTGYISHGATKAVATDGAKAAILSAAPKKMARAMTVKQLLEEAELEDNTTTRRAIQELVKEKRLNRMGDGKKGKPYRYWAAAPASPAAGSDEE